MSPKRRAKGDGAPTQTGAAMDDDSERETDRNGVEFGSNCLTPGVCRGQNLCLGTCKLF